MFPHIHNPFDTRSPGDPSTEKFLHALMGSEEADAYREAMGDGGRSSTTDAHTQELTPEELERLRAAQANLRETQEKKDLAALKADYLAWAREFELGGDDPEQWVDETFTFNQDGTVKTQGDLDLSQKSLTRLPPALTLVNGVLNLSLNKLTSLEGLPQGIHGYLSLAGNQLTSLEGLPSELQDYLFLGGNPLTSLEGLRGKKMDGNMNLMDVPAQSIPEGIELVGQVIVRASQTTLKQDAISKGYTVRVQ